MTRKLVAEIGGCNGDLQYALDIVDALKDTGIHAIKAQLFTADTLTTRDAKTYGKGLSEPATQWEAFSKTLSYDDWFVVRELCDTIGIRFFASVFDFDAVLIGVEQKWEAFKVASGDITNQPLIRQTANACLETSAELIMSTGASTLEEIQRAVGWAMEVDGTWWSDRVTLLVCTLSYPTDYADANVSRIQSLQHATMQVGYSDHTRGLAAADYAFRIGASMVEKHVTLTPGAGSDHDFAITPDAVGRLVNSQVETNPVIDALVAGDPEIRVLDCETEARVGARRSIVAAVDIKTGDTLTTDNLAVLRPGGGMEPWQLDDVLGQRAQRFIPAGTQLSEAMFGTVVFGLTVE